MVEGHLSHAQVLHFFLLQAEERVAEVLVVMAVLVEVEEQENSPAKIMEALEAADKTETMVRQDTLKEEKDKEQQRAHLEKLRAHYMEMAEGPEELMELLEL